MDDEIDLCKIILNIKSLSENNVISGKNQD